MDTGRPATPRATASRQLTVSCPGHIDGICALTRGLIMNSSQRNCNPPSRTRTLAGMPASAWSENSNAPAPTSLEL
ncbi:hypothetical protein ACTXJX_17610 [Glutamicibacter ardleyensis]